jgi:hypothetical protein
MKPHSVLVVWSEIQFRHNKENEMSRTKLGGLSLCIVLGVSVLLSSSAARAQLTKDRLEEVRAKLQAAQSFYNKLTPEQRKMLSGTATNFFRTVEHWPEFERQALAMQKSLGANRLHNLSHPEVSHVEVPTTNAPVQVSNPVTDFAFGPSGAFTQSETSTAWCGSHVVVGFNDSGSLYESLLATGGNNLSFNGYSLSTTAGTTYSDLGFLPAVTGNPFNFLEGDPVLACSSQRNFYYASIFATTTSKNVSLAAVSLSRSDDGGAAFGGPVIAAAKDATTHFLDKLWMAVSPAKPNQIAITYTDFDTSGAVCGTGIQRVAIEMVASRDGGNTWSSPTVIAELCETGSLSSAFVQGSQVAFSASGAVNVAFEFLSNGTSPGGREIFFTQAPALGKTFGALVPVTPAGVIGVGDGFELQGGFRAFIDLQGMTIDRSGTSTNGDIYVVWHDTDIVDSGQDFSGIPYLYSDVWISRGTPDGTTWSAPVQVDSNKEPLANGLGTDSYMPGVAVDNTSGEVGVCWYDRRNDPLNYRIDRFCGHSSNAGASFTNFQVTTHSFMPIHGTDDLINPQYMGDYDTVASDGSKATGGFIGAFQVIAGEGGEDLVPNPRVQANNFN